MTEIIDYYFATISPYAYLGHDRFTAIAKKHGATVAVKPINLGEVFPVSGGLPLSKRAPQRQAYRLVELVALVAVSQQADAHPAQILSGERRPCRALDPRRRRIGRNARPRPGRRRRPRDLGAGSRYRRCRHDAGNRRRVRTPGRLGQARASPGNRGEICRAHPGGDRPAACSARRPTSSPANCSGDRIDSTSSTAKWQNSVFSTAGSFRASFESWAGRFLRGDRFAASCTSGRESRNA